MRSVNELNTRTEPHNGHIAALEQERVPAGAAHVLAEGAARLHEGDPAAEQDAAKRMPHERLALRMMHERVAAAARVLRAAAAFGHAMTPDPSRRVVTA